MGRSRPEWGSLQTWSGLVWKNFLLPEVQEFITELILEVVRNYNVGGIQGDDRLSAMPLSSGYDPFSQKLYNVYSGESSPSRIADGRWTQFRCDLMIGYLRRLVATI